MAPTKDGINLFSKKTNNILNLFFKDCGSTIKRVFVIIAYIIALPIIFFILALTCKILKLMF